MGEKAECRGGQADRRGGKGGLKGKTGKMVKIKGKTQGQCNGEKQMTDKDTEEG